MNEVAQVSQHDLVEVMRNSLYPSARPESVALVLKYCAARHLDPMLKPVHIVPMYVRDPATGRGEMRDIIMPGVGLYRIEAARTGQYAGKSEPRFGPTVEYTLGGRVYRVPEWCSVTVSRIVGGQRCDFTALEYWIENYATKKADTDEPNSMWARRPRGQLAKCAEAQALRMAFPEATGQEITSEEMEGKTLEPIPPARGPMVDAEPVAAPSPPMASAPQVTEEDQRWPILAPDGMLHMIAPHRWHDAVLKALLRLPTADDVREWRDAMRPHLDSIARNGGHDDAERAREVIADRLRDLEQAEAA